MNVEEARILATKDKDPEYIEVMDIVIVEALQQKYEVQLKKNITIGTAMRLEYEGYSLSYDVTGKFPIISWAL